MLRFAPSLTGDMNVNDLRVALFNFIVSKKLNEELLIRIEDIDKERFEEGKDKEVLELLNLFSIDYTRVLNQSSNFKYYQKLAMQLMGQKKAFACFCSDEKLEELKQDAIKNSKPIVYDGFCEKLSDEVVLEVNAAFTVRIKRPNDNIKFDDLIKGTLDYSSDDVDSFVILTHDKNPTSNYACAIDDMLYDISFVIDTEDKILNTPKQIHIRNSLGYSKKIDYLHLPKIELQEEISIKSLIEEGFLPAAIANYLVLLGNKTPKDIFTLEEAIEWFDIKNISLDNPAFDIEKLKIINKKHLILIDELRLSKLLGFADEDIGKLAKLFLEEVSTLKQIKEKIDSIFSKKLVIKGFEKEVSKIINCLQHSPYFENLNELQEFIKNNTGLNEESLSKPLYYVLTGLNNGPNLNDIYPLIKNYLGEIVRC
ncbi:glutamate--tRNA ligase [Malaciobacter molluscorum]|uniref:glutamate--tRNA ligase n=1 Tax=Malaciobacter molluscorum TaxID=1032072 RepID=UPI00100B45F0|nr:glutamate--tRNA ligase [Malaciobacter molluscorum]RXJ93929.1 glutamate--tRNA ligase [Malaciobacter molluscorum]